VNAGGGQEELIEAIQRRLTLPLVQKRPKAQPLPKDELIEALHVT
jgi:hypothetical protein